MKAELFARQALGFFFAFLLILISLSVDAAIRWLAVTCELPLEKVEMEKE